MGNFISNLIARHTTAGNYVQPRLRGRFEPLAGPVTGVTPPYLTDENQPAPDDLPASRPPSGIPRRQPPEPGEHEQATPPVTPAVTRLNTISAAQRQAMPPSPAPETPGRNEQHSTTPLKVQVRSSHETPDNNTGNGPAPIPGTVNSTFIQPPSAEKPEGKQAATTDGGQRRPARSLYFSPDDPGTEGPVYTPAPLQASVLVPTAVRRLITGEGDARRPATESYNAPEAETPPVIKVTIGRIDVRAVPQPASAKTAGAPPKGVMSLDDYLKKRSGGTS